MSSDVDTVVSYDTIYGGDIGVVDDGDIGMVDDVDVGDIDDCTRIRTT